MKLKSPHQDKFQFFGSMTERSVNIVSNATKNNPDLGPGSYEYRKSNTQSKQVRKNTAAFLTAHSELFKIK